MTEKEGLNIKSEKKRWPQWARNIVGVVSFLGFIGAGVAIGLDRSNFEEDASALETAEDIGNFALPVGVGLAIGSAVGLAFLGGIDNDASKTPATRRTPEPEQPAGPPEAP